MLFENTFIIFIFSRSFVHCVWKKQTSVWSRFDSRSISIHDDVGTTKLAMNYAPFFVIIFKSLVRLSCHFVWNDTLCVTWHFNKSMLFTSNCQLMLRRVAIPFFLLKVIIDEDDLSDTSILHVCYTLPSLEICRSWRYESFWTIKCSRIRTQDWCEFDL